jgi:hypothetical protein
MGVERGEYSMSGYSEYENNHLACVPKDVRGLRDEDDRPVSLLLSA